MNEQSCKPDDQTIIGSLPANIPQFFLFLSGGLYYYASSCCVPPEHWGVLVSPRLLLPGELGCPATGEIPKLPSGPSIEETGHSHALPSGSEALRRTSLCGFYSTGNIGNSAWLNNLTILGTAGVLAIDKPQQVTFQTDDHALHPFLENRIFNYSIFEISLNVAREGHFEIIHFLLHLAECVDHSDSAGKISPNKVSGVFSEAWSDPLGGGESVKAGRLLKLQAEDGIYKGSTIFVSNDVS